MSLDREQLENLKRRLEDDFRLDLAAIDRLERYVSSAQVSAAPPVGLPAYSGPAANSSETQSVHPRVDSTSRPDDLTSSLRAMFSHSA